MEGIKELTNFYFGNNLEKLKCFKLKEYEMKAASVSILESLHSRHFQHSPRIDEH